MSLFDQKLPDHNVLGALERHVLLLQREGGYQEPSSVDEAKKRQATLVGEIQSIESGLARLKKAKAERYFPPDELKKTNDWRSRAVFAKTKKVSELKWIKLWYQLQISKLGVKIGADPTNYRSLLEAAYKLLVTLAAEEIEFDETESALIETIGNCLDGQTT